MKYIFALVFMLTLFGNLFSQKERFSKDQLDAANTAVLSTTLTDLEKEVIMNINLVRLYPKQFFYLYADSMAALAGIDKHHDNYISLKSTLIRGKGVDALLPNENLNKMALEMCNDIGSHGIVSHTDSKKRNFKKRAALFNLDDFCAENIDFGRSSALEIVFSWLFDIDVPSLGHRENLLNPVYKTAGVSFGYHKKYSECCVLDLASK